MGGQGLRECQMQESKEYCSQSFCFSQLVGFARAALAVEWAWEHFRQNRAHEVPWAT